MKHVIVDLEMNTVSRKSEVRAVCKLETIEIGAVMLDDNMQEIASFRTYVKPEHSPTIASNIRRLTGITNEMVANAPHFNEALRMFMSWCLGTGDEVTLYAWSDNDYKQISAEIKLKGYEISEAESALLMEEWTDFQKEFDVHLGFDRQLSLRLALDMAGIDFTGREHDALDDARNTAQLLQIYKDRNLFDLTLSKIAEVMKPSSLGNTLGSMFDFSAFSFAE